MSLVISSKSARVAAPELIASPGTPSAASSGVVRRADLIDALARRLASLRLAHPLRVAVTGRDGAGKSALADALAPAIEARGRPVVRASIDGFHRPGHRPRADAGGYTPQSYYDEAFDLEALRRRLLDPLDTAGDRRVRLAAWDARVDAPAPAQDVVVAADAVVLVDGVFLLRPELLASWDLVIWLEVPAAIARARLVARDLARGSADEARRRHLERIFLAHDLHLREGLDMVAADVVIDNSDPEAPRWLSGRNAC